MNNLKQTKYVTKHNLRTAHLTRDLHVGYSFHKIFELKIYFIFLKTMKIGLFIQCVKIIYD